MNELDVDAWERYKAFRKAIKKPIREVSEGAAKLKLQRFGADQAAVVDQSIANGWQGLFDLKKSKNGLIEKPVKSEKQIAAEAEALEYANGVSRRHWDSLEPNPYNRLKLCDALWARYTVNTDQYTAERLEWLKDVITIHLREVDAKLVVGDPALMTMVWCFYGERGANRIKDRAKEVV